MNNIYTNTELSRLEDRKAAVSKELQRLSLEIAKINSAIAKAEEIFIPFHFLVKGFPMCQDPWSIGEDARVVEGTNDQAVFSTIPNRCPKCRTMLGMGRRKQMTARSKWMSEKLDVKPTRRSKSYSQT